MLQYKDTTKIHSYANSPLEPDQIRRIRKRLGLTQAEAGRLLGGGPRAFSKYEAGTIAPATALVVLLRLLDENPELLGRSAVPFSPSPFEVTASDVANLAPTDLPSLLRRLLHAEAHTWSLSTERIHVPDNTSAPDGGEDGRIQWEGEPERTPFLPGRFCQLQLKAQKIGPAIAGREVLRSSGRLKPMVRDALRDGGYYILMCSKQYVQAAIQAREESIRSAIRNSGLSIRDDQIRFRDANQVAEWVNAHPAVAVWVLERTHRGVSTFGTWANWKDRSEHSSSPWVADDRLPTILQDCAALRRPRQAIRFVGLSGIGKSRLLLEALGPENLSLHDLVLYSVQPETHSDSITELVRRLSMSGRRAVVVVDGCSPETHSALSGLVRHKSSQLSLVSIDHQAPSTLSSEERLIHKAPHAVTDGILNTIAPRPDLVDKFRLARFARGFPQVAVMAVASWRDQRDLPVTDDEMVDRLLLGRDRTDTNRRLQSAALLAIFGRVGMDSTLSDQRREIAAFGRNMSEGELYSSISRFERQGVARRRGRYATMDLFPVVAHLAEKHWREAWTPVDWDRVFTSPTAPKLKVAAATNLALLSAMPTASRVVSHVLRRDGPFGQTQRTLDRHFVDVLGAFAAIDPRSAVNHLAPLVDGITDFRTVTGDLRRSLVNVAVRIASSEPTFSDGAELLLRLAVAENESYTNNATGWFSALFSGPFAPTLASGEARIRFLRDISLDTFRRRELVVGALRSGVSAASWDETRDGETATAKPKRWNPESREEAAAYVQTCAEMLTKLCLQSDASGVAARSALADELRSLVRYGFVEPVENAVRMVLEEFGTWSDAAESLGFFLETEGDKTPTAVGVRVRELMNELQPDRLDLRVRQFVTEMPHDYPFEKELDFSDRVELQWQKVRDLAAEAARRPRLLVKMLPELCRGTHRHAYSFGEGLAHSVSSKSSFLDAIVAALRSASPDEQNSDLLSGYLRGVRDEDMDLVRRGKQLVIESEDLWSHYCRVCSAAGLESRDVETLLAVLPSDGFPVSTVDRWCLEKLDRLDESTVMRLFSALIENSREAYWICIRMLKCYMKDTGPERHVPDVLFRTLFTNYVLWGRRDRGDQCIDDYNFHCVVKPILERGRDDDMARAASLAIVTELVQDESEDENRRQVWSIDDRYYRSLLSMVLARFPDIAWPLVGGAIVTDESARWRMESVLGGSSRVFDEEEALISALPVDTMISWCRAHPGHAPVFAGRAVPILDDTGGGKVRQTLHPMMQRVLDEFGGQEAVREAVISNLHCYTIHTRRSKYFGAHVSAFRSLEAHREKEIRQWARRMVHVLERTVERSMEREEERDLDWDA